MNHVERPGCNTINRFDFVTVPVRRAAAKQAAAKPATVSAVNDLARLGFAIKQGEKLSDVTITVTDGAANVRGKIILAKEMAKQPSRMRIAWIPL